jgi:hypothetical protein
MGLLEPNGRGRRLFRRDELIRAAPGRTGLPPCARSDISGAVIARSGATTLSRAPDAPVIVVHALAHAVAALTAAAEAGRPIILASAPGAGIHGGPGWWRELIAAARAAVSGAKSTALLDCGDNAGAAQGAIRAGVEAIVYTGPVDVAERLADIAGQRGCRLVVQSPPAALDLAADFFAPPERLRDRCAEYLRPT